MAGHVPNEDAATPGYEERRASTGRDVAEHGEGPERRKRVDGRVVPEVAVPEAVSSGQMPLIGVGEVDEEIAVGPRRAPAGTEQCICELPELSSEECVEHGMPLGAGELGPWSPAPPGGPVFLHDAFGVEEVPPHDIAHALGLRRREHVAELDHAALIEDLERLGVHARD
jgi:hypothetical protein